MTHRGPFQPLPFYDSVILSNVSYLHAGSHCGLKDTVHGASNMEELCPLHLQECLRFKWHIREVTFSVAF